MRPNFLIVVAAAALAITCQRPQLIVPVADRQLRASEWFTAPLTTYVTLTRYLLEPPDALRLENPQIAKLEEAGFVRVLQGNAFSMVGAHVELTSKGKSAATAGWKQQPDGSYLVPMATRQIDHVFNIQHISGGAICSVAWRWQPTEIGRILEIDSKPKTSIAEFVSGENGWTLHNVRSE